MNLPIMSEGTQTNFWRIAICSFLLFAASCSTEQKNQPLTSAPPGAAAQNPDGTGNLSGLWVGKTSTGGLIGMPGLTRSIKLDLQQTGEKITGTYHCYSGKASNSFCRNFDEKGSIQGEAHGTRVNLNIQVLPDASNCIYTGILDYNGNGNYICYWQGSIVEQGTWQLTPAYPPTPSS
jgi:hypothetical protein